MLLKIYVTVTFTYSLVLFVMLTISLLFQCTCTLKAITRSSSRANLQLGGKKKPLKAPKKEQKELDDVCYYLTLFRILTP